ncbi:MAG: type II toxin-antitoxin system HipA family toxin [Proteobacteria bacterium]|nr:type II toxin-antitoxin system HipA family toxin [Pseudomonadota bacterium]
MSALDTLRVKLWGRTLGALSWHAREGYAELQYTPEFRESGLQPSPLLMPLRAQSYAFAELADRPTFSGLPGMIADSLPERFGNRLLERWLARQGRRLADLTPIERLAYLGRRGIGALEYEPDTDPEASTVIEVEVDELVRIAEQLLQQHEQPLPLPPGDDALHKLIQVGTSAGGAKAKAIVAWNEQTQQVMSGQADCPSGFTHWLIKFDGFDDEGHAASQQLGRVEYAYHVMAVLAGIEMTECRLFADGERAHFMTRRFDRGPQGQKLHVQTYCALAHADRNPPGAAHYEGLFATARALGLGQDVLDQLFLRMVFNLVTRNQDDHTKNHAFLMDGHGRWRLAPAYDLCFSYNPASRWIDHHQLCCNGKRDGFTRDDLQQAARAADLKRPLTHFLDPVREAVARLPAIAADIDLPATTARGLSALFRSF